MADARIQQFKSNVFKALEDDQNIPDTVTKSVQDHIEESLGSHFPDTKVYRWAIASLGIVSILIVVGAIAIVFKELSVENQTDQDVTDSIPEFFGTIIAMAIGAIAGIFGYARGSDT